ncbi:MAG: hypothetical protein HKP12_03460 [Gammaproteobacteria bacterium]|nr:hypothetical protein [Gammaproteobacteria bacterium]NNJ96194.1 hypothetical protein [Gammaproteobacteria bacterium]
MTLEKARELIAMHVELGSGYNRNAARMVLGEVMRDHGQKAVDQLIRDYGLDQKWGIEPGTRFESAFK